MILFCTGNKALFEKGEEEIKRKNIKRSLNGGNVFVGEMLPNVKNERQRNEEEYRLSLCLFARVNIFLMP